MISTKVAISDVIVPEIFARYVIERTPTLSAFAQSGIMADPGVEMPVDLTAGGSTINLPFWHDLDGDDEVLSDSAALSTAKISAGQDLAVMHFRGKAWKSNQLAAQLAGDDPMAAIGNLSAEWWARKQQSALISTLTGAFGASSMSANVSDISGETTANYINGETFIDAAQHLGDAKSAIAAVAMHSAVEAALAKNDLIQTVRDSDGKFVMNTFMGKRVIVDDSLPASSGIYTTYLFAPGAIAYKEGGVMTPVETDRDSLAGDDILINRRAFILHPRGVKWIGTPSGVSPTNAELATGANWSRVYDAKNIKIVQFKHRLEGASLAVAGLTLDKSTASVVVAATTTITATVTPSGAANKTVIWTSSDETKATVAGGVVTGVAAGTAVIIAATEDGGYTAVCTVTVTSE